MKNAKDKNVTVNCRHVVVVDASHDEVKDFLEKIDSEFNTHYIDLLGLILVGDPTFRLDIDLEITDLTWDKSCDTICSIDINGIKRSTMGCNWVIDEEPKCNCSDNSDENDDINDYEDDDDSEDISDGMLWCNMWQNTGMKDQPIYEYCTHSPNGVLGDAVGTIRVTIPNLKDVDFLIDKDYVEEDGCGFIHVRNLLNGEYYGHYEIHTNDDELRSPWYVVTDTICDVQNYGRGAIYFNSEEVINCIKDISDKLNLGYVFEERYCHEEMSDYTAVFSKDLAEKLYLGKTVQFAYKIDVAKSIVEESENGHCDYELRDVAIEEPDGYISHEKAYVIFFDNEEERQMNA